MEVALCFGFVLFGTVASLTSHQDGGLNAQKTLQDDVGIKLWPEGKIFYYVHPDLDETTISKAMQIWEKHTCVEFVKSSTLQSNSIVVFQLSTDCQSETGWKQRRQNVSLTQKCTKNSHQLLHELGHVIGLGPEISRPDRDQYVTVNTANIRKGYDGVFTKMSSWEVWNKNFVYDYNSIMHFRLNSFAKSPYKKTLKVLKNIKQKKYIGRWPRPSFGDFSRVNAMYNCRNRTKGCVLRNEHCPKDKKAFVDKNCRCVCPGLKVTDEPIACGCKQLECQNYGTFDPRTCSCDCIGYFSGTYCEKCEDTGYSTYCINDRLQECFTFPNCPTD